MNSEELAARIQSKLSSTPNPGATNPSPSPPPRIPDHELLARIGAGSYGEVWLARSVTGGLRAVKIVWRHNFSSDRPYDREFRGIVQFEPISRSHPGVVNVLHVGRDDAANCFYYVMELADAVQGLDEDGGSKIEDGNSHTRPPSHLPPSILDPQKYKPRTLAADLRARGRMPVTDTVTLGVQLANALGHLHRHGLVHRDVKPSNVIFVNGQAKLADIGLVAGMDEARSFVGTEGFIAPEGPGSEQADLFSLGRLLYEIATGKDRCEFPMLPADLDRWPGHEREVLLELNEVLARACAVNPKDRHANAAALAGDLNVILAGRSVRRAYGIERRLRNATRVSIAAIAVAALSGGVVWFLETQRRQSESRAAHEARLRERAETAERETQQQLYTALLEQARATVRSGELGQRTKALDAVRIAAGISNSAALRGVALAAHALPDLRFERELPYGHEFPMRSVDPAFERIAVSRARGPVEIRSTTNLSLLATLTPGTNLPTYGAEWSPEGRYLAIKRDYPPGGASSDKEVWDTRSGQLLLVLHDAPFDSISFHPRLPQVLVGRSNGVAVWDLETRSEVSRSELIRTPLFLRYSPEGERFAASFSTKGGWFVSVHRSGSGELISSNFFDAFVGRYNWHPSGHWLAVPDYSSSLSRFDAETGEKRLLGRHKAQATETRFSPDGNYLMSGGWDRELVCWDARTLQRPLSIWLNGYIGWFRADGQAFALQTDTAVQFHSFERDSGHREFAEDLGPIVRSAAFSADGRWLAAAGTKRIGVWNLQHSGPGALAPSTLETRVAFAASGELFADRLRSGFRWRVSPATNTSAPPDLLPLALALPEGFASLGIVANGVALTGSRGSAVVKAEDVGSVSRDWQPTEWGYNGVSPEGRWFAVFRPYTPYLFVHRLPGLQRVTILTNASNIRSFQFSPTGDELAVSCRLGVEFWNTTTWQRTRAVTDLNNQLYSADGQTMWLTQQYRAGGLHDARTLELLMPLPIGTYPLAVSPDGRRLAVSVDLRRLQVWDLEEVRGQLRDLGLDLEQHK